MTLKPTTLLPSVPAPGSALFPRQTAIIDIGAHSIRLEIFQKASESAPVEVLEQMSSEIALGLDVFRKGSIGSANINRACEILQNFAKRIAEYGISECRAVATSAVREAQNRELFLDRLHLASGIHVEVLESQEEARYLYSAIKARLQKEQRFPTGQALLFVVGTGSLIVMFLKKGKLQFSEVTALGSVRIFDEAGNLEIQPERIVGLLKSMELKKLLLHAGSFEPDKKVDLIGVGAPLRALLKLDNNLAVNDKVVTLSCAELMHLAQRASERSVPALSRLYGFAEHLAVSIAPASCIAEYFFTEFNCKELLIPQLTTRDAILHALYQPGGDTAKNDAFHADMISATENIGKKYNFDLAHARACAAISLKIFDKLKKNYQLAQRERTILEVASLLHDIGRFVDVRQHHKHSYYLLANSQLPGLSETDLRLSAAVARYHRKSPPKPSHLEYLTTEKRDRVILQRLAAILRVSDSLVRETSHKYRRIDVRCKDDKLILHVAGRSDLLWETMNLARKGDFFEEVFGLKLEFEEELLRD